MINTKNFNAITQKVKQQHAQLVAVSKTKPASDVIALYEAGQRIFGENKVQEMVEKKALCPADIAWHLIGHLQSNKVKYIVEFVSMIHSIDSLKLLEEVNRRAAKCQRVVDCLLQFHIATEETKFGLDLAQAKKLLSSNTFANMQHVRICGVMGMASFSNDTALVRSEFRQLKNYFDVLKKDFFADKPFFKEISMGMSGDYAIALEEGSTLVRVGSLLFGERNYYTKIE
ncbi:MAG: YggS family pyridoxal phosphate-dependent enzyme [Chitinophagales bacterium]|nr:YggS family pyridoxal phosphate-dependent enzyme [Bacteroidota bacterium]MCB9043597.1 YggS family pyridoxal phosphate-dependent enzyme [Chitinophagales bacterium]